MNKNTYLFISIAIAGIATVWYLKPHQTTDIENSIAEQEQTSKPQTAGSFGGGIPSGTTAAATQKKEQAIPETIQERLDAINNRRPDLHIDSNTLQAKMAQTTAWSNTDTIPKNLPLKPEEFTDGRHFIAVDDLKIETLMPGDKLNINIPDTNNDHEVVIDTVEKHDYNSITWYGHINGADGQTYSVSMTRGETLTVAGFDTPDGHFVLQGQGKDGWIASSSLLFKEHTNPIDPQDVLNAEAHTHTHDHTHTHE